MSKTLTACTVAVLGAFALASWAEKPGEEHLRTHVKTLAERRAEEAELYRKTDPDRHADRACYAQLGAYKYTVYERQDGRWTATQVSVETHRAVKDQTHSPATRELLATLEPYYQKLGQPSGYGSGYFTQADVARVLGKCAPLR